MKMIITYNFWLERRLDLSLLKIFPFDVTEERVMLDCLLSTMILKCLQ